MKKRLKVALITIISFVVLLTAAFFVYGNSVNAGFILTENAGRK